MLFPTIVIDNFFEDPEEETFDYNFSESGQ